MINRWLWDNKDIQQDLIELQIVYKDLGYELTLEQCYDAWYMYSQYCEANWLRVSSVENSKWCIDRII